MSETARDPMTSERLVALDVLRGFTIIGMIVVNSPGSWSHVYGPLLHAPWHGLTLTDLVFPFFLFIVGVSISLAFTRRLEAGANRIALFKKAGWRALKIFALGLFLNSWPSFAFDELRVAGVLQRIAIVFLACAGLFLSMGWRGHLAMGLFILAGYWTLLAGAPVPLDEVNQLALETGVVERALGQAVDVEVVAASERALAANYEPGTNLAAWIDRQALPGAFWEQTWDPEGLASTVPAIATGLFGMLIGQLLLRASDGYRRVSWVFFAGFIALLCGEIWSWTFPLNKNLWSSSFVLVTGGWACMAFASFLLVVDVLGYRRWTQVALVFGANAVVSYALSGMLLVVFYGGGWGIPSLSSAYMEAAVALGAPPKLASLSYALLYVGALYVPAYLLWRRRIFIRL